MTRQPRSDERDEAGAGDDLPEPRQVRRLRLMVSGLTLASAVAVLAIAGTVVVRLGLAPQAPPLAAPAPVTAEALALPAGERITAIGQSGGAILAVTEDASGARRLRRWDAATGALESVTPITREAAAQAPARDERD